jgi:hypothetical protein
MLARTDEVEFGPAMLALPSDKWRTFVFEFVLVGLGAANAAAAAGSASRTLRPRRVRSRHGD